MSETPKRSGEGERETGEGWRPPFLDGPSEGLPWPVNNHGQWWSDGEWAGTDNYLVAAPWEPPTHPAVPIMEPRQRILDSLPGEPVEFGLEIPAKPRAVRPIGDGGYGIDVQFLAVAEVLHSPDEWQAVYGHIKGNDAAPVLVGLTAGTPTVILSPVRDVRPTDAH